jgi:hypothetical protein
MGEESHRHRHRQETDPEKKCARIIHNTLAAHEFIIAPGIPLNVVRENE